MTTCQQHARRNAAVARRWFSTGHASACSEAADQMPLGMRARRLSRTSEHPMAPVSSLVIDDLWNRPSRSGATASSLAVKSP
jgi:hypothetical protein